MPASELAIVLIVDDEAKVRDVLRRWLEKAGYQTRDAPDAESALAMLAASPASAALCDVQMPGHSGLWLARQIRERYPTVGVVFATAEDALPPTDTLQDGVVAYVLKPFDRVQLIAAVQRAVQWHETTRQSRPSAPRDLEALDRWLDEQSSD